MSVAFSEVCMRRHAYVVSANPGLDALLQEDHRKRACLNNCDLVLVVGRRALGLTTHLRFYWARFSDRKWRCSVEGQH